MNKKSFSRFLIAITFALGSICLATNTKGSLDSGSDPLYHNSEFNFTLQIPKGWHNFTSAAIRQQSTLEKKITVRLSHSHSLLTQLGGIFQRLGNKKILLALALPNPENRSVAQLRIFSIKPHWYTFNTTAKDAALGLRAGLVKLKSMKSYNIGKKHTLSVVAYSPIHSTVINGQQFFTLDAQYLIDKKVKTYESFLFTSRNKHIIAIHTFATSTKLLQQSNDLIQSLKFLPIKTT
jgi:hypothetical protein